MNQFKPSLLSQSKSNTDIHHLKTSHHLSPQSNSIKNIQNLQTNLSYKKMDNQLSLRKSNPGFNDADTKNPSKIVSYNNFLSPKNTPGSPKMMSTILQNKNQMKVSLIKDDFTKNIKPTTMQSPKRIPRMSEHNMFIDLKASTNQFKEQKKTVFHHKNEKQIEPSFKKKHEPTLLHETIEDPIDKDPSLTSSSGPGFASNSQGKSLMSKSNYDPTTTWVKESWGKKKQKKFTLNDFNFIKELGAGKYGKVYLVTEKKTKFVCALKMIEKKLLKQEEITDQFIRELKIQMFLNHPNIIKMYGFFDDNAKIYIILQVGTGGQLFKHLKKSQSMPQHKVAGLMRQICQSVNQIHSNQIIHRDLKPENIVLHDGVIKVCDFGWSVHLDKNLRTTFCGTPLYVSPEILRGKEYDEKIDIWSLGVMMYEMVVGENPFKITKEEELVKIVKDAVVIPSYVELSRQAKDFLDCCLQKNPETRSNIRELLNHSFFRKYPDKTEKKMNI